MIRFLSLLCLVIICGCSTNRAIGDDCKAKSATQSIRDCYYEVELVCGCDDVTYRNACFAKANGVKTWSDGPCEGTCIETSIAKDDAICFRDYNPVCGCDGNTYSNACVAYQNGIVRFTEGECGATDVK